MPRAAKVNAEEVGSPFLADPPPSQREMAFDVRALTPIYKGSSRTDGIDEKYPLRGPSLRGQLRIWWRALQPTTSLPELRAAEHRIFGGVHQDRQQPRASRVRVGVSAMSSAPAKKSELKAKTGGDYSYALWVDRGGEEPMYHVDAKAQVHVSWERLHTLDEPSEETLAALRGAVEAMVLFGGAGSRTRRGLGRLWSDALFGAHASPSTLAKQMAGWSLPPINSRPWPSLAGATLLWGPQEHSKAGAAVDEALIAFQALRGMRSVGNGHFEGDQRLCEAQKDWSRVKDGKPLDNAFTAALGMPLAYRSSNNHLDGTTMVSPAGGRDTDRLPSPIHIRPVPVAPGQYRALILAMRPWFTGNIRAKNRKTGEQGGSLRADAIEIVIQRLTERGWARGGQP